MAFTPQAVDLIDDCNRADGAIQDGAGAAIWTAGSVGSASGGNWLVASNRATPNGSGTQCVSLAELPADMEVMFDLTAVGATYLALYFSLTAETSSGWEGYWLLIEPGVGTTFHKRVAGVSSSLGGVADPGWLAGDKVSIHRVGDVLKMRRYTSGAWIDAPLINITDSGISAAGPVAFEAAGAWSIDNLIGNAAVAEAGDGGGGGPVAGRTLFVDADHPDATDDQDREDVTEDQPLKTLQRAAMLAMAGVEEDEVTQWSDGIVVKPAAMADATNALDTSVYYPMHHNWTGGDLLPFGDNTGNRPIRVQGLQGDGAVDEWDLLPKMIQPQGAFKNWIFESADSNQHRAFQCGYDVDSGDDNLNVGSLRKVSELIFRDILFTGGAYEIKVWDDVLFERCWVRSPYSAFEGSGNRFLDGVGFHLSYIDNNDGEIGVGPIRWTECIFDTINGEDAIQIAGGGVGDDGEFDYSGMSAEVDHNLFMNVVGVPGKAHTDSIQTLGGQSFYVHDNAFLGCDDCFIASDYHHGTIRFENNLCAGSGFAFQAQGTDLLILRHNTVRDSFFRTSVAIGERTEGIVQKLIIVNNVLEDYLIDIVAEHLDDESIISHNIVAFNPGFADNLDGLPEFGTSARMDDLPDTVPTRPTLGRNWELANSPVESAGIGEGVLLDNTNGGALAEDRLGRAYSNPPDVGCHQSDPGTLVTPAPRSPYVLDMLPVSPADAEVSVSCRFYPVPGNTVVEATITGLTAYVTDPAGEKIPAVLSLTGLDEDGYQTLTMDLKASTSPLLEGTLYPLVTYTAHLTASILDSDGSPVQAVSWSFTVEGPAGPAIYGGGGADPGSFTLAADPRFHVGQTVYLWRAGGHELPFSVEPLASSVVDSDSTTTFTGLAPNTPYLAGFTVSGPFISFRT